MTLDPAHIEELVRGSGIALERAERMFDSLDDAKACAKLTGFPIDAWTTEHLPALAIKYHFPFGGRDHQAVRIKAAKPLQTKKGGKGAKYVTPAKARSRIYYTSLALDAFEDWQRDVSVDVLITEGEKKAESAASAGFIALSIPGVTQWHARGEKRLHPDFLHASWEGRRVNLCLDRDALSNNAVRTQECEFAEALIAVGSLPHILRFPEDAPKLDDCLVKYGREYVARLIADAPAYRPEPPAPVDIPARGTELTDLGNAERFVMQFGEQLRHCRAQRSWFHWDGKRWSRDDTGEVHRLSERAVREIYAEASRNQDRSRRAELAEHAHKSESRTRLEAMIALACTQPEVVVRAADFDRDPWLLNTPAGTVDLRTGDLRAHKQEDLITKMTRAPFERAAQCPRWEGFVAECMGGDVALVAYLQRVIGYALTADIGEHCLFFFYGGGANGKSTFINTIMRLLGDYAKPAASDLLLEKRGDAHPTGQADLCGARLVSAQEVGEGRAWAEPTLKALTGGDPIPARRMREDWWWFEPTHKLFVSGNHKPRVRGGDDGIWRRLRLIPFDVSFKGREDRQLERALAAEASGILAWAVRGCLLWQRIGLAEPPSVRARTEAYRRESDSTGEFFATRVRLEPGATTARSELRTAYETWCLDRGERPVGAKRLAEALRVRAREHGVEITETSKKIDKKPVDAWRGVRLATPAEWTDGRDVGTGSDPNSIDRDVRSDRETNPDHLTTNHYVPTDDASRSGESAAMAQRPANDNGSRPASDDGVDLADDPSIAKPEQEAAQ